ncbi:unnamed protein product [Cuscuta epithymum]|uniref:Uncharacterized protein n=1 Tax=Cuscuta epithymum TaxID=186058 RepID=A0AAV0ESV0_9ASTE|nr:unnamed protein product [Cuscuta epithymum]
MRNLSALRDEDFIEWKRISYLNRDTLTFNFKIDLRDMDMVFSILAKWASQFQIDSTCHLKILRSSSLHQRLRSTTEEERINIFINDFRNAFERKRKERRKNEEEE